MRVLLSLLLLLPFCVKAGVPNFVNCDDLSGIEEQTEVDYDFDIQPIWNDGCTNCHGFQGNLSLEDGEALDELIGIPAFTDLNFGTETFLRVDPGRPLESWLFLRVNCDIEGDSLFRMPRGGSVGLFNQRLIFDWISQGAGDFLFSGGFEEQTQ